MIALYVTYKFFEFIFKGMYLLCALVAGAVYGAWMELRDRYRVR